MRAGILNGLGALAIQSDEPVSAGEHFSEAVAFLHARDDPAQLGEAYLGRATAAAGQGQLDVAIANYARARISLRQANDTLALLRVDANQGFLDLERGLPAQALPQMQSASQGFEQWGALNEAIISRIGETDARLSLLQTNEALDAVSAAERLPQRIESRSTLVSLALTKSQAPVAAGQWSVARRVLSELRESQPPLSDASDAVVSTQLASILLGEGKPVEAFQEIESVAERLAKQSGSWMHTGSS